MAPSWFRFYGGDTQLCTRSHSHQARRARLDHQELRNGGISQLGSGSAEGLQGAGVGDHFLAQECVTQSVSTGPDPAVRRALYLEGSGSACTGPHPQPRSELLSLPPLPRKCVSDPPSGTAHTEAWNLGLEKQAHAVMWGRRLPQGEGEGEGRAGRILVPCCPLPKRSDKKDTSRATRGGAGRPGLPQGSAWMGAGVGQGQDTAETTASRKTRFIKTYSAQTHWLVTFFIFLKG